MATPTSPVDISNLALDLLKQAPITSIDTPSSTPEQICARWYDVSRREMLEKHPWNFAIKRRQLTPNATAPEFGYAYAYDLPSDFIRLATIGDDAADEYRRLYEIENGQLLLDEGDDTDGTTLFVRYVYNHENPAQWSPLFVKCLALQMAVNMAAKFAVATTLAASIQKRVDDEGPWAMSVDGQARPPKRIQRSKWLTQRKQGMSTTGSNQIVFE